MKVLNLIKRVFCCGGHSKYDAHVTHMSDPDMVINMADIASSIYKSYTVPTGFHIAIKSNELINMHRVYEASIVEFCDVKLTEIINLHACYCVFNRKSSMLLNIITSPTYRAEHVRKLLTEFILADYEVRVVDTTQNRVVVSITWQMCEK